MYRALQNQLTVYPEESTPQKVSYYHPSHYQTTSAYTSPISTHRSYGASGTRPIDQLRRHSPQQILQKTMPSHIPRTGPPSGTAPPVTTAGTSVAWTDHSHPPKRDGYLQVKCLTWERVLKWIPALHPQVTLSVSSLAALAQYWSTIACGWRESILTTYGSALERYYNAYDDLGIPKSNALQYPTMYLSRS